MLALPDGHILFSDGGSQLFVYQPSTPPLAAGKPHISSITPNGNGSYHLTGTLLNGISAGAAYGDDVQMDSNYPLVRVTDGSGNTATCAACSTTALTQAEAVVKLLSGVMLP